jgi:integrase
MPLTNATCLNAKPAAKPYKLADGAGLYLQVMPNGSKYWRLKYRFGGKEKLQSFGVYPEVSLAEARSKRDEARKQLATDTDPTIVKRERKLKARLEAGTTFEVVAREWHELNKERWTPRHGEEILYRMERDVFPQLGRMPIAQIKPLQLLQALRKVEDRGAHELTRRALQYCGSVFRYAVVTERAERDITPDLRGALRPFKRGHYAAFESDDLPEFLKALERNQPRLFPQTLAATRLLLLTFVRTSELIEAQWSEIKLDEQEWIIPAERMKMRRPHIVPLSSQAVTILRELKAITGYSEWVFPNQIHSKKHMSNATVLGALRRLGYKGRMTGHGFRALAMSTIKEKLGYRHEVVDRQLAHAPGNKVDAAYDRAKFLDERRKMMQEWADYLDRLKSSEATTISMSSVDAA